MSIDENILYECIGDRLKQRRGRIGMTQSELAELVKLSRTSIANIEAGQQNAPLHVIYEICAAIKLEPSELFPRLEEIYKCPIEVAEEIANRIESEGSSIAAALLRRLVRTRIEGRLDDPIA